MLKAGQDVDSMMRYTLAEENVATQISHPPRAEPDRV